MWGSVILKNHDFEPENILRLFLKVLQNYFASLSKKKNGKFDKWHETQGL